MVKKDRYRVDWSEQQQPRLVVKKGSQGSSSVQDEVMEWRLKGRRMDNKETRKRWTMKRRKQKKLEEEKKKAII